MSLIGNASLHMMIAAKGSVCAGWPSSSCLHLEAESTGTPISLMTWHAWINSASLPLTIECLHLFVLHECIRSLACNVSTGFTIL